MAAGPSGGELQPQPTPSDRQTPPEAEKQKAGTRAAVTPLPMLPVGRPSQEPRCRQAQAVPVATEEGPLLPGQGVRAGCSSAPRPLPLPMPGPGLKSRCAVLRGGEKGASDLCARLRWAPALPACPLLTLRRPRPGAWPSPPSVGEPLPTGSPGRPQGRREARPAPGSESASRGCGNRAHTLVAENNTGSVASGAGGRCSETSLRS